MGDNCQYWRQLVLVIWAIVLGGCASAPSPTVLPDAPPSSYDDILRHYAPVIYQGAASDQDFITAVDFDGDWVGNNNWENQPTGDLSAAVYASLIETESHWYLFYSLFHPRDYTAEPCEESDGCHENDMESLQLAVYKDGSAYGQPQALFTLAHSHIYLYRFDRQVKKGTLKVAGKATLEGSHPVVWVESYGHGIYGRSRRLQGGLIKYRLGAQGERPASLNESNVSYRLISIYDTLWQHRQEIGKGKLFDQPFIYRKNMLPASFDGNNFGVDKANAPWGYNQEIGEVLHRGDFFLDPARAYATFASVKTELSPHYLYNLYLDDLTHKSQK
ncbi:MAG: hypothetical protein GXP38_17035 [Chloroflexi bacterium]|nr:hypothetical protein [Chloroflexota bacterium]